MWQKVKNQTNSQLLLALAGAFIGIENPTEVRADGGALRYLERQGGYEIAVFTAPAAVRVGPVDISVLVQDAGARKPIANVEISVQLERAETVLDQRATAELATNKLFQAAHFDLPLAGTWSVCVRVRGPAGDAEVVFDMEVTDSLPPWRAWWPWVFWPIAAIGLFLFLQYRNRPGIINKK
ncbi:MAG: hypothetical protein HY040_28765 [Planctomycetes bacterium]|nr:hypothetical protein [Planctomycetota bacterium]